MIGLEVLVCCTGRYNRIPVGKLVCMVLDSVIEYHSLSISFYFFGGTFGMELGQCSRRLRFVG